MHKELTILLVAALAAGAGALPSRAEDKSVEQRLAELEEEVHSLKQQEEALLVVGKDGFGLKSADGNFLLRLRGQLQFDGRFYLDDDANNLTDTFLIRRARPFVDGTIFRDFDFRLMPDFGGGTAVLQDGYIEWTCWPAARLRVGKFKAPVSIERVQSDADSLFVEAGFTTALVPFRDVGVQLSGDLFEGVLSYAGGVFDGVVDGVSSDFDQTGEAKELAFRVFAHPFKKTEFRPLQGLGIGVAVTYGDQEGSTNSPVLPNYKTAGQQTFFSYRSATNAPGPAFADGYHTRLVPQAYYYWGRFGLLAEYAVSDEEVTRLTAPASHTTAHNTAWEISGSFLLTDDTASFRSVNPKRPFDLKTGGWGAWELIARVGQLEVDKGLFTGGAASFADPTKSARRATAWGVGLNWYLNKWARAYLDYEQTAFDRGAATGDRPDEKTLFTRLQLLF